MSERRSNTCLRALMCATAACLCLLSHVSVAQTFPNPSTTAAPDTSTMDRSANAETSDFGGAPLQVSLSASQIISILQSRPELMVEIKDLIAQTQHADNPVQADSITDQMVYAQIISDKELRQSITIFLRARGYVNDEDLQRGISRSHSLIEGQAAAGQLGPASERIETGQAANAQLAGGQLADLQPDRYSVQQSRSASSRIENGPSQADREAGVNRDANTITNEPPVLRRPAPYNLASLRDLYTQIPDSSDKLKRFGSEAFVRRDRAVAGSIPLDVPVGPDYVLGPGDNLTINLWGGVSQTLSRVVSPDGHLSLPEAGDIQIAGLTLEKAQGLIQDNLKNSTGTSRSP